jgi:hypothetical protein
MRRSIALALVIAAFTLPNAARATTARTTAGLEGVPAFDHVFVLMLENENAAATWADTGQAPYLNKTLKPQGVFVPNYYGTGHVSLDNYIAMVSGQPNQPVSGTDCLAVNFWMCVQAQKASATADRNLADQLDEQGVTWKGYMDSMPSPCFHASYDPAAPGPDPYQGDSRAAPAYDYADRHNPFIYFPSMVENDARCRAHVRPYGELANDLATGNVPRFGFISPDTCHDGHDKPCSDGSVGGLKGFDNWLAANVPPLLDYLRAHNGLLLITADEDGFSTTPPIGCCSGGPLGVLPGHGGRIGLLALAPSLGPKTVATSYDHMSFLRTVEDVFGISEHLNNAAQAQPMADVLS